MIATVDYIRRKFNEFNQLCFNGELKPLPIKLSKARSYLGKVAYRRKRNLNGTWRFSDFELLISTVIDRPEQELEDVILHEMIHYWILSRQLQDDAPHGTLFTSKMNEINTRFNRHIAVSHRSTREEHDRDQQVRVHRVCISTLSNGVTGITIAAQSRLFHLWDAMAQFPGLVQQRWIVSVDPYFNRFPRALKPKMYRIDPKELEQHLQGDTYRELERHGNRISVKK